MTTATPPAKPAPTAPPSTPAEDDSERFGGFSDKPSPAPGPDPAPGKRDD